MTALNLRFGVFKVTAPLPGWLQNQRSLIASKYSAGSQSRISLDTSILSNFDESQGAGAIGIGELYGALESLTLNPENGKPPQNIGVLYADTFDGQSDTFGIMFDPGPGVPGLSNDGNPFFNDVPRQGCAVFLKAIAAQRKPGSDYDDEVLFTTLHELGHVFNLWHIEDKTNLLCSSANFPTAFAPSTDFLTEHKNFLALCSDGNIQSQYVRPGGTQFGSRGTYGTPDTNSQNAPDRLANLSLTITPSQHELFPFFPAELDVKISVSSRATVILNDMIDPGYPDCEIWQEEPDGERRKYRPPQRYCRHSGKITITRGNPFRRDVTIFGDANGYFFRKAGRNKIWMVLKFADGSSLTSNTVDVQILSVGARRKEHDELAPIFLQPKVARLLYHRYAPHTSDELKFLRKFVKQHPKSRGAGPIHYALGRIFHRQSGQTVARKQKFFWKQLSFDHLRLASQSSSLGDYARSRAREIIDTSKR